MKTQKVFAFIFVLLLPYSIASADWVWSPEQGKFINSASDTQSDADDIFDNALDLYKDKKLDKATEQFKIILKKYPKSRVAPEAQYRLGTIYEEKSEYVEAHKAYQALIKSYPQSQRFEEVIEREYQIGSMFLSGKKGKILGLEIRPSLPLAIEVFQKTVDAAPYGAFGDKSQFSLGVAYQKSGRYDEALEAFQTLIDQYPQSPLLKDARLQMAEVSYAKSSSQTRDQSALDEAARQAQGYLKRYPGTEEAAKAAQINQEVDELNAEKNYRIGIYYEKDNYLESALIYYRDTAKRYGNTAWGRKAADKLNSLQEPVKYLNAKEEELRKELGALETKYQSLGAGQKAERAQLKKDIDAMKKAIKALDKNKAESLERRKQDLKRRERELKEKFEELERKKKRFKKNTSPDFQKAIDRWQSSLEAERDALAEEKDRIATWRSELGVSDDKFYENLIPSFLFQSETPLEKVQCLDEKPLYKLSKQKKALLTKKEKLYKHYSELQKVMTPERAESGLPRKRLRGHTVRVPSKTTDPKLLAREKEIASLEAKLDEKMGLYEKQFGKLAEQELEAIIENREAPKQAFNPLSAETGDLKAKDIQELLELKMHLVEQVKAQQDIVDTLSTAFDRELAMKEQRDLMKSLESEKETDIRQLRKETKSVEKDLRRRYQDIQDRHKRKLELLAELDRALHPDVEKGKVLRAVAKPVTGTIALAKAFIFGLSNDDETLTREASKPASVEKAKKLQQEIELESLMIEAQDLEINNLEKKLEMLNAKASLGGGMKFRSSFVKVPYAFIEEAVQSARRVVPRKDRKSVLLNRLDNQTQELDRFKAKLEATETVIKEKTPAPAPALPAATVAEAGSVPKGKTEEAADEKELRDGILGLQEQLEIAYSVYSQEQGSVLGESAFSEAPKDAEGAKRYKEFQAVRGELSGVVDEELVIEQSERAILEKRIAEADKLLPSVNSKAMQQDLETEKARIGQRLADLVSRHDFLTKEKERFSS